MFSWTMKKNVALDEQEGCYSNRGNAVVVLHSCGEDGAESDNLKFNIPSSHHVCSLIL